MGRFRLVCVAKVQLLALTRMSAYGYKQTSSRPKSKSALPPGADILDKAGNVSSLTRSDLQFVDFELEQGGFRLESPVLAAARSNRWKYCPSGP